MQCKDTHKTNLSKKECLELIKKIDCRLTCALDNISWTAYYTNYLKDNVKEEKSHQGFKPDNIKNGLTVKEGGMFFSVYQIIEYLETDKKPMLDSYLYCRKSIYMAYSLVAQYKEKILEQLKDIPNYKEVLNIDYCYLTSHDNKGRELY